MQGEDRPGPGLWRAIRGMLDFRQALGFGAFEDRTFGRGVVQFQCVGSLREGLRQSVRKSERHKAPPLLAQATSTDVPGPNFKKWHRAGRQVRVKQRTGAEAPRPCSFVGSEPLREMSEATSDREKSSQVRDYRFWEAAKDSFLNF